MNRFILTLIALRVLVDGVFNFNLLGLPISGFISALILVVFLSTAFSSEKRKTTLIILVTLGIFASSFYAFITLGVEPVYEAIRFTSILAAIHLVLNTKSEINLQNLLRVLGTIGYLNFAFQIFQQTLGQGLFVNSVWRYAGFFAHPNTAALFYGLVVVLVTYQIVSRSAKPTAFLISLLVVASTGIALTLSVGGILFALISVSAVILSEASPRLRLLTLAFAITGIFVISIVFPDIVSRLNSFTLADAYLYGDQTNSLVWRFNQWVLYYAQFERTPLFGAGFGGSTSGYLAPNGLLPHNEYLRVLVETGALGAIACLLLVSALAQKLLSRAKDSSNWAARCSLPLVLGLGVNAVTENTFLYTVPMLIMAVLLATSFRNKPNMQIIPGRI